MSFLEMLDVFNEQLIAKKEEPVAFEHDCREGICGTCAVWSSMAIRTAQCRHHGLPVAYAFFQRW
jgi:succinate dehydrogenase/fumarate reductase-like Fe-S protein